MDGWPTSPVWFQSLLPVIKSFRLSAQLFKQANTHTHTHFIICTSSWEITFSVALESLLFSYGFSLWTYCPKADVCLCICEPQCAQTCTCSWVSVPCYGAVCMLHAETASVSLVVLVCMFLFALQTHATQKHSDSPHSSAITITHFCCKCPSLLSACCTFAVTRHC